MRTGHGQPRKHRHSGDAGHTEARCFSLIEVVLGMGLLAVGFLGVAGLLPVSLQATRDSVAESYAADNAEQLLHYLALRLRMPDNDFANWTRYGKVLPTIKPDATEPTQTWSQWYSEPTTTFWSAGSSRQYYRVERRTPGVGAPDFTAIYRIWRSDVTFPEYVNGTWVETPASDDMALMLNVEVSWPAGIPYNHRNKGLYSTEIYRPVLTN